MWPVSWVNCLKMRGKFVKDVWEFIVVKKVWDESKRGRMGQRWKEIVVFINVFLTSNWN